MNKTLSVNVGGYAFTIEENAAEMLEAYLNEIRGTFRDSGNAGEIMADIENRIGELLTETKGGYEFITAGMVEAVKKRIGNPSDINDTEDGTESEKAGKPGIKKRLYRNIEEKNIGGVCSGLAAYFGIDVVWFRIAWTLLTVGGIFLEGKWIFRNGSLLLFALLSYVVLWICIPAAKTVRQKCEMRGAPVKLAQYRDYVPEQPEVKRYHRPFLGKLLGIIVGAILLTVGIGFTVAGVSTPIGQAIIGDNVYNINISNVDEDSVTYVENAIDMLAQPAFWWLAAIFNLLMGIGLSYAGTMLIFGFNPPKWHPGLLIFVLWLISLVVLSAYSAIHVFGVTLPFLM